MPLNAEVSFKWVGHFGPVPPLIGTPNALQEPVGSGAEVLDIKPGDIV